jgi:hypothetical protein
VTREIQKSAPAETCKGVETDSRVNFDKEIVAGAHRRPKWVPYYSAQADSGRAQDTQALLRHTHPQQVKSAVAHVRRLKRNQRKGKLILSLWVFLPALPQHLIYYVDAKLYSIIKLDVRPSL